MARRSGRAAFHELLKSDGITHLFGNPGTTQLPNLHALGGHPEITYVWVCRKAWSLPWQMALAELRVGSLWPQICSTDIAQELIDR